MIAILKVFGEIQYKHIVLLFSWYQNGNGVITQNSLGYLLTLDELNIGFKIGQCCSKDGIYEYFE